jgi:hypothetical protein
MEKILKLKVEIEGTSPILFHKFNGKEEEKAIKEKSDSVQAESHAYRLGENLAIPAEWFKGCIREYLVSQAASKTKTTTMREVSPRINVSPYLMDLNTTEFKIDKRAIPVKKSGKIVDMDYCVRPRIDSWKVTFTLTTTLDKTIDQWKADLEGAGIDQGIGSNNINGYGRFKIISVTKI